MPRILFDEYGAAQYLGGEEKPLSVRTLQRQRSNGSGPAYIKIGRLVRYCKSDLDTWIEAQRRRSTNDDGISLCSD